MDGEPGIFKELVIGRVYIVHPNIAECYYLRVLLLHTLRDPTSIAELHKVDDIEYPTYQAAVAPHRLRHLFDILLTFCELLDAGQLWQKYQNAFAEDILRQQNIDSEITDQVR